MHETESPELNGIFTRIADLRANDKLPREEIGRRLELLYKEKQQILNRQRESPQRDAAWAHRFLKKIGRR